MKKVLLSLAFALGYAAFLGLGLECLLQLLGMAFAISLDGGNVLSRFPRFIPFCVAVGLLALAAVVLLVVFNLRAAEKFKLTKGLWLTEVVLCAVALLPLAKLWAMLLELLQKSL